MAISAEIEAEIATLSSADQELYLAELGINESGLNKVINVAYKTLGLSSFSRPAKMKLERGHLKMALVRKSVPVLFTVTLNAALSVRKFIHIMILKSMVVNRKLKKLVESAVKAKTM